MGTTLKYVEKLMKVSILQNLFTKTCHANNYFARDPHFVILAWVQS